VCVCVCVCVRAFVRVRVFVCAFCYENLGDVAIAKRKECVLYR